MRTGSAHCSFADVSAVTRFGDTKAAHAKAPKGGSPAVIFLPCQAVTFECGFARDQPTLDRCDDARLAPWHPAARIGGREIGPGHSVALRPDHEWLCPLPFHTAHPRELSNLG